MELLSSLKQLLRSLKGEWRVKNFREMMGGGTSPD
jgi:hypothetical protein